MVSLMQISFWLSLINVALLVYLVAIHVKMLKSVKSSFTIGLLIFVLIFLLHNILYVYFYLTMMELYANGTDGLVFVITLMETIGFTVFTWISRN